MKNDIKAIRIEKECNNLLEQRLQSFKEDMIKYVEEQSFLEENAIDGKYLSDKIRDDFINTDVFTKEITQGLIDYYAPFNELCNYYYEIHCNKTSEYYNYMKDMKARLIDEELQTFAEDLRDDLYYKTSLKQKEVDIKYSMFIKKTNRKLRKMMDELADELLNIRWRIYIDCYRDGDDYYELFKKFLKSIEEEEQEYNNKYSKMTDRYEIEQHLKDNGYYFKRQNGTSHAIYSNGEHSIPVPIHGKSFNKELAYGIQKEVFNNK